MDKYVEIYCLNKLHSRLVCTFLKDLQDIIDDATYYDEDVFSFEEVISQCIVYHNKLGAACVEGELDVNNWYHSLANNVFWVTNGYFASLENEGNIVIYKKKVISLIENFILDLDLALVIDPYNYAEGKINLN
jgi:hypothetical protein|tara:strand:- start:13939 stop:14337 length:399 start_codon:yes stop_codon:yes gene_type:complete